MKYGHETCIYMGLDDFTSSLCESSCQSDFRSSRRVDHRSSASLVTSVQKCNPLLVNAKCKVGTGKGQGKYQVHLYWDELASRGRSVLLGFVGRKQSWLTKAQEGRLLLFKSGFGEMGGEFHTMFQSKSGLSRGSIRRNFCGTVTHLCVNYVEYNLKSVFF